MNKRFSMTTRALTEGALFCAIYMLFVMLGRYIFTGVDSLMFYFVPIPLVLYTYKYSYKEGLILFVCTVLLSFLYGNWMLVLTVWIPNLGIGVCFGVLLKCKWSKIWSYILLFFLCFGADILSVYAFEAINHIGYFSDMVTLLSPICQYLEISESTLSNLVQTIGITVLLMDSLIKTILIVVLLMMIEHRFHYAKQEIEFQMVKVRYNPWIAVVYLVLLISVFVVTFLSLNGLSSILQLVYSVLLFIFTLFSFYLFYQAVYFFSFLIGLYSLKKWVKILLLVLMMLFFSTVCLVGMILNFIRPFRKKV